MTEEQYGVMRAFQQEQALRELMAFLSVAFPVLANNIDIIGRNWDSRLDALDAAREQSKVAATQQEKSND